MIKKYMAIVFCSFSLCLIGCTKVTMEPSEVQSSDLIQEKHPDIVFVMFEDMSPRVGAFGDPLAVTPNFDKLAKDGVKYTNVFTTAGVCAPSRASLLLGRHQMTTGTQHMRVSTGLPRGPQKYEAVPPALLKGYPELMRANGYYTTNNFKTDYQVGEPFTIWDESSMTADWRGRAKGQPFFAMFTLLQSHESFLWPVDREPTNATERLIFNMVTQFAPDREYKTNPAHIDVPPYYPDNAQVRKTMALLYDNISYTDKKLGEIIQKLKDDGLYDETVIVVTTDHGDGLPRAKRSLYDSGIKVPMVIKYPMGRGAGTVDPQLISFIDLTKSFLSWTNTPAQDVLDGIVFEGPEKEAANRYIFAQQDRMDEVVYRYRAVRDNRYKYIRNYLPGEPYFQPSFFRGTLPMMQSMWAEHEAGTLPPAADAMFQPIPRDQLFDLQNDPHEVFNLADQPDFTDVQNRLENALDDWMNGRVDLSEKREADMIETMWPGKIQPLTAIPTMKTIPAKEGVIVTLSSATEGASIGYQTGQASEHWQLYSRPVQLQSGVSLRAKAIRYGYKESEVAEYTMP